MKKDGDDIVLLSNDGLERCPNEIGVITTADMMRMYGGKDGHDVLKLIRTATEAVFDCPAFITDRSIMSEIVRKKLAATHPDIMFPKMMRDSSLASGEDDRDVLHHITAPEVGISMNISYKLTTRERWLSSVRNSFAYGIGIHIVDDRVFTVIVDGGLYKPDKYSIIEPDCVANLSDYMKACARKVKIQDD